MFVLPELPYPSNALAPAMSEDTVKTHHGKHHAKYVEVTNQLVDKLGWNTPTLEELGLPATRVNSAGCLDRCELGPVMVIYPEGVWYHVETREDVDEISQKHLIAGGRVERLMMKPEDFADKAFEAIEAGASYRVIPWQMAIVAKLMRALPNALYDRLLAGRPRKHRQATNR